MNVPKFSDLVFYPFSNFGSEPLICDGKGWTYLCVFVDYMPKDYIHSIELARMVDLIEFAQSKKVDRVVISYCEEEAMAFLLSEYIDAAKPE